MTTTKNLIMRTRLEREVKFDDDFRKRFMTKEYGNYEKYENNNIEEEIETGKDDNGKDKYLENYYKMMRTLPTD
jgi:hypothetical protein